MSELYFSSQIGSPKSESSKFQDRSRQQTIAQAITEIVAYAYTGLRHR
jgi:hypothetical protein